MEIKLQNIRKRFGETVALDDLSLEFCDGKLTTLLGPSGCGKSTLLNFNIGNSAAYFGIDLFRRQGCDISVSG